MEGSPTAVVGFLDRFGQIDWFLVFVAFIGASFLYILTRNRAREPFSILKAINVKMSAETAPIVIVGDIILTSACGAFGVYILTGPTTPAQAMVGGLGFVGLLSAFGKEEQRFPTAENHIHERRGKQKRQPAD